MKLCEYCLPYEVSASHIVERGEFLLWPITKLLDQLKPPTPGSGVLKLLLAVGLLKLVELRRDDDRISRRSQVLVNEAIGRGLDIKLMTLFGKPVNLFSIVSGGQRLFFEGLPHVRIGTAFEFDVDNKEKFGRLLEGLDYPHTGSKIFLSVWRAKSHARLISYPVVVKPNKGSLSKHVTYPVNNEEELVRAIKIARMIAPEFIVERFVSGKVHRISVVDYEHIAVCIREPLIEGGKVTLAAGARIHDVTELVHPDNADMFRNLARACKLSVIGFDFICADISRPYKDQKCAFIEANSLPFIDMHHYPTTGKSLNVATWIMDELEAERL